MRVVFSLLCLVCLAAAAGADTAHADLILVGGKVWTGDSRQPQAEAVAVRHGRIVAVGKTAEVKRLAGSKTRVIDLSGRRVVPGFHDSHVHLLGGGMRLAQVALKDAKDEAEFGRRELAGRLLQRIEQLPPTPGR